MALITCPECGNECSDQAESCPKCGYPLIKKETTSTQKPIQYETKTELIRVWGRAAEELEKKLKPYYDDGWEVVNEFEDPWLGGAISPVYRVTMRRPKKEILKEESKEDEKKEEKKEKQSLWKYLTRDD